ncbi:hypothetical protein [Bacillus thuringiensis]|uniref:hypothetical protein n=1 Tax=Bacillus thuringiensis TaxID=1428 RepID=UPI000BEC7257|nr:hypothetical protein [Bacillus thuringiensis]EKS8367283.1 hypothetical protein [Bacillus cereus]EKS8373261.1 hypothetical protein [Bacillus cereus]MBG9492397.1 hypothetical protein [Bacillus thuringiensis]MBG9501287.1 hypothetical protein [Bacillus thuringiensis]MBG9509894.1 hypothetical protein [Bacillus thuringiensis]
MNSSQQKQLLAVLSALLQIQDNEHVELDNSIRQLNIPDTEKKNVQDNSAILKSTTEIAKKLVEKLERYK